MFPAGIYGPRLNFDTVTAEDMIQTFTTNAIGPLLVVQQLCRHNLIPPGSLVANVTSKVRTCFNHCMCLPCLASCRRCRRCRRVVLSQCAMFEHSRLVPFSCAASAGLGFSSLLHCRSSPPRHISFLGWCSTIAPHFWFWRWLQGQAVACLGF